MTKDELINNLNEERNIYRPKQPYIRQIKNYLLYSRNIQIWKYVKTLRLLEYYYSNRNNSFYCAFMNVVFARKFNKLGYKLGIELEKNVFESGLTIYHTQGIVVNGDAKVGKNCMLHGANVIGNMGNSFKAPVLGDNVRLGVGAKVLGDVYIADNVQIGAGAIVLHSCYEKGALLVGIPAKVHK